MMGRTLMADQKEHDGQVRRHIFDSEFMDVMVKSPFAWTNAKYENAYMPQHLGYNIAACDFIFAPICFSGHWFCYVVQPRTLTMFVLDSLVEKVQKKKDRTKKYKHMLAVRVKDNMKSILVRADPATFQSKPDIKVTYPRILQQPNTHDCGMHVITWLQQWDNTTKPEWNDHTMPLFTDEQMNMLRVEVLWWLVSHPANVKAAEVMEAAAAGNTRRTSKRATS